MNCEYCDWIEKVLVAYEKKLPRKKNNNKKKYQRKRRLEPIIIVHGSPDENKLDKNIESSVELIKKIIIEKYDNLLKGKTAIEIMELMIWELEKLSDLSIETWRETILVDDKGGLGCVAGLILDHSVTFAKDIFNRKKDVLQIINNCKDKETKTLKNLDETIKQKINNNFNIKSGCWSVIVRDLEENMSCGRTNWRQDVSVNSDNSINASTTVYGCGIFLDDESCCSVAGNDEIIYLFSLAKKISQSIEENHKHSLSNEKIEEFTNKFNNISCVFLGPCERPVINCKSEIFPWIYCCKERIYSGVKKGEENMKLIESDEAGCRCYFE